MAAQLQIRYSNNPRQYRCNNNNFSDNQFNAAPPASISFPHSSSSASLNFNNQKRSLNLIPNKLLPFTGGGSDGSAGIGRGGGNGGGGGDGNGSGDDSSSSKSSGGFGILSLFLNGWRSRVAADPQFPFKVLMEELVGVTACVLGDMASRPNFGLNELDFVFSTLVVGSILNFTLVYLLTPTLSSSSPSLPAIFASCPPSHMFERGAYSLLNRCGTFANKGAVFAVVGFAAGLVGTVFQMG